MTFDRKYILCFGRDATLVDTRRRVLGQAGYAAMSTTDDRMVEECLLGRDVSILVLCHSLSDADVDMALNLHKNVRSTASILSICAGHWRPARMVGRLYDTTDGPAAFVAAITQLSGPPKRAALNKLVNKQPTDYHH